MGKRSGFTTSPEIEARFWSKVKKTNGCWLWTACRDSCGYGQFGVRGMITGAHRFSWFLATGTPPKGKVVMHKCDVPACVRPDHLSLGTQTQNVLDCVSKGRNGCARGDRHGSRTHPESRPRGERHTNAKLSDADVVQIRQRYPRESVGGLASEFGVSRQCVRRVATGLSRRSA